MGCNCVIEKVDASLLPKSFNKALFLKAWVCVLSRSIKTPHGSAVIPAVDMFNHRPEPDAILDWDDDSDTLIVRACRKVAQGHEVCIAYGELSNPLLYRTYGFTVPSDEEPKSSCTFKSQELCRLCEDAGYPEELAECVPELPELHLDAACCDDTLALYIQTLAALAHDDEAESGPKGFGWSWAVGPPSVVR